MDLAEAGRTHREVMRLEPQTPSTPYSVPTRDFLFSEIWTRPGLSRRDRRWATLTCVAAAEAPEPIDAHVYAAHVSPAPQSGDIAGTEMDEIVLQFSAYCGLAKGEALSDVVESAWARINACA